MHGRAASHEYLHPAMAAVASGIECALVYGALANLLTFALPLLHRPTDASLEFALLAHVLVLVPVVALIVAIAGALRLASIVRRADRPVSVPAWTGPAALATLGVLIGWRINERELVQTGVAVFGLCTALAVANRHRPEGDGGGAFLNWTSATLLAAVPFLAQPRAEHGWPGAIAAGTAAALVVLSFVLVMTHRRRPDGHHARRGAVRGAAVACLCLAGLTPGWLAREVKPVLTIPPRSAAVPPTASNVILVTLDTVRADHLSVYGYERDTTPNLRAWWRAGATRYTRAFSTSDMTLSSHASIFTGLLPSEHGAHRRGSKPDTGLSATAGPLAARLQKAGFVTAGIAANSAYLSGRFGFDTGFDYYDARRPPLLTPPSPSYFFGGTLVYWLLASAGPDYQFHYRSAASVSDEALELLPTLKASGQPFFLFLNLMDAHTPIVPPARYRQLFGVKDRPFYWLRDHPQLVKAVNAGTHVITADERAHLVASYDAAIAHMDAQLGRLFAALTRLELLDDTLIIVTSDHGELFGRSGALGHDGVGILRALFEVPLLIRYPGSRGPADDDRWVSAIDLYSTILAIGQVPQGDVGHGRSLLRRDIGPDPPVLLESFESAWLSALNHRFQGTERGALVGGHLIRQTRTGDTVVTNWPDEGSTPHASLVLPPGARQTADAALRQLTEAEAHDRGSLPRDDGVLDRLRSLGYLMR